MLYRQSEIVTEPRDGSEAAVEKEYYDARLFMARKLLLTVFLFVEITVVFAFLLKMRVVLSLHISSSIIL